MKEGYERRLEKSFQDARTVFVRPTDKIVLFSDCHRGIGNANDNFLKNQELYFAALKYYYKGGFTYIELGDGEELWENRSFEAIREIHDNVYRLLSCFRDRGRLYMICGNHDFVMKDCVEFPHDTGLILKICEEKDMKDAQSKMLYLTHGHQADALNSTFRKLSRFLVRYLWKPLELRGVLDPTSAAKNYRRRTTSEKRLSRWANKKNVYLVAGHTHRPVLGDKKTRYFNAGSCVHPGGITCLEVEGGKIRLIKWHADTRPDRSLYVERSLLAGPVSLDEL